MSSPFASDSEIVLLNAPTLDDAGNEDVFFTKRTGTLPSGKQRKPRYTVEVRSEPILLNFDETNIGQETAMAYRDLLADQIRHITEPVKAATLRYRTRALEAWNFGASWTQTRYSGGRIGPMPPNPNSRTKFNDSGRLSAGLFVRLNTTDKSFTINLPTNRMNPELPESPLSTVLEWMADLRRLVPALDPNKAVHYKPIQAAIERDLGAMIETAESALAAKLKRMRMARKQALKQALVLAGEVFGG